MSADFAAARTTMVDSQVRTADVTADATADAAPAAQVGESARSDG